MINFEQKLQSIKHLLDMEEEAIAASECVKLTEQVLRYLFRQYQDRIDESVRQQVQKSVRKRDRRKEGIEGLTMGQLVHVLQESRFLEAWARVTGKSLSSIQIINFEKLTQLRNKIIHDGAEATRAEAEFLFNCLKVLCETFEIVSSEELRNSSNVQGKLSQAASQSPDVSGNIPPSRVITVGRDYIEASDTVNSGHFYGSYAQPEGNIDPSQMSREDILTLLSAIQQELEKLNLPSSVKKEASHEIDGAKIQAEKEPPNKKKMVEKLKHAEATLKEVGTLGKEAIAFGNLLGKAITWGGEKWVEWMI